MTVAELRERAARDFWLEGFRDFLALESGLQHQEDSGARLEHLTEAHEAL